MRQITRSTSGETLYRSGDIFNAASSMLQKIERRWVRLIGISLSGLTKSRQMSFIDNHKASIDDTLFSIQRRYGRQSIQTGSELHARKQVDGD
jgi:hypothetical protein